MKHVSFGRLSAALLAVTMLLSSALVGCGSSTPSPQTPSAAPTPEAAVVEAWLVPTIPDDELIAMVDEFNKEQAGKIKVNLTILEWKTYKEKIAAALSSKQGPDVFYIQNGLEQIYVEANILEPVTSYMTKEEIDQLHELCTVNSVDGAISALPLNFYTGVLYYRKDILAQYGYSQPPQTWDELKSMAAKITKESGGKVMGFQLKGADDHLNAIHHTYLSFLGAAGGVCFDENGKSAMASPQGIETLTYLQSFYGNGIAQMGPSAVNGFVEGTVAMFNFNQDVVGTSKLKELPELKDKWGICAMPKGPIAQNGYLGGQSIAVNATSANKAAAGEFAKWYASPKHATDFMKGAFGIPVYKLDKISAEEAQAIKDLMAQDQEIWDAIYSSFDGSNAELLLQERLGYTARTNGMKSEIISCLSGNITPTVALQNIDKLVEESIRN